MQTDDPNSPDHAPLPLDIAGLSVRLMKMRPLSSAEELELRRQIGLGKALFRQALPGTVSEQGEQAPSPTRQRGTDERIREFVQQSENARWLLVAHRLPWLAAIARDRWIDDQKISAAARRATTTATNDRRDKESGAVHSDTGDDSDPNIQPPNTPSLIEYMTAGVGALLKAADEWGSQLRPSGVVVLDKGRRATQPTPASQRRRRDPGFEDVASKHIGETFSEMNGNRPAMKVRPYFSKETAEHVSKKGVDESLSVILAHASVHGMISQAMSLDPQQSASGTHLEDETTREWLIGRADAIASGHEIPLTGNLAHVLREELTSSLQRLSGEEQDFLRMAGLGDPVTGENPMSASQIARDMGLSEAGLRRLRGLVGQHVLKYPSTVGEWLTDTRDHDLGPEHDEETWSLDPTVIGRRDESTAQTEQRSPRRVPQRRKPVTLLGDTPDRTQESKAMDPPSLMAVTGPDGERSHPSISTPDTTADELDPRFADVPSGDELQGGRRSADTSELDPDLTNPPTIDSGSGQDFVL